MQSWLLYFKSEEFNYKPIIITPVSLLVFFPFHFFFVSNKLIPYNKQINKSRPKPLKQIIKSQQQRKERLLLLLK